MAMLNNPDGNMMSLTSLRDGRVCRNPLAGFGLTALACFQTLKKNTKGTLKAPYSNPANSHEECVYSELRGRRSGRADLPPPAERRAQGRAVKAMAINGPSVGSLSGSLEKMSALEKSNGSNRCELDGHEFHSIHERRNTFHSSFMDSFTDESAIAFSHCLALERTNMPPPRSQMPH